MHRALPGNPLPVLYDNNHIVLVLCQVNAHNMRALNFESNRLSTAASPGLMICRIRMAGWERQAARLVACRNSSDPVRHRCSAGGTDGL